jgi:hypothetical protein
MQAHQFARFIAPDASELADLSASSKPLPKSQCRPNPKAPSSPTNLPFVPNVCPDINPVYPASPASWSVPIEVNLPDVGSANPPSPKSNAPVLGSTFTFIIKGSAHLGPSFSADHSKGGVSSLFMFTRTETNDVNVVLTPSRYETTIYVQGGGATQRIQGKAAQDFLKAKPLPRGVTTTVVNSRTGSLYDAYQRLDQMLLELKLKHSTMSALPNVVAEV